MAQRRPTPPEVHLNMAVRGLPLSATLAINERSAALQREGRHVYRFGLGQSPFPVPRPVVEELKANAHQKDYLAVQGLRELRGAVAEYYDRTQGVAVSPDNVMIGPGSKELMFLLQLAYYGDLVIPTPSWVSYAPQANIVGRPVRWMDTHLEDDWQLHPDRLAELCEKDPERPRLLILNYPANPSGTTYRTDELKAIAAIARRYRVLLLSDEIYGELHHQGQHVSVARFYPEGTIISSGLSKWCGAGGWRLGTFVFPPSLAWLRDALAAVASETFTSTSAPIQYAAVRAFRSDLEIETYLRHCRRLLRRLGKHLTATLREAGVLVPDPKGAFYLFVDFGPHAEKLRAKGIDDSATLCEMILEDTGVAILPGSAFGRPTHELSARLAYVDFDGARALAAVADVPADQPLGEEFLRAYCPSCVEGIERVAAWLGDL